MSRLIKILHIDPDYQITYLIYRHNSSIRTSVPLKTAIELLKKEDFDLILSEPHNKAILKKTPQTIEPKPGSADDQTFMRAIQGDFRKYDPIAIHRNRRCSMKQEAVMDLKKRMSDLFYDQSFFYGVGSQCPNRMQV